MANDARLPREPDPGRGTAGSCRSSRCGTPKRSGPTRAPGSAADPGTRAGVDFITATAESVDAVWSRLRIEAELADVRRPDDYGSEPRRLRRASVAGPPTGAACSDEPRVAADLGRRDLLGLVLAHGNLHCCNYEPVTTTCGGRDRGSPRHLVFGMVFGVPGNHSDDTRTRTRNMTAHQKTRSTW